MKQVPKVIAVAGGSGSGKTTLARKLIQALQAEGQTCTLLSQDSYYIDQSARFDRDGGAVNFDHPSALEFSLLAIHLQSLRKGLDVKVPVYDFATHKRVERTQECKCENIIIVDGTLILSQPLLRTLFDEAIFLEVDEATRLARRLKRDVEERGRTPEGVREQFYSQVKTMHDEYVEPSKTTASILLTWNGKGNTVRVIQKHDSPLQTLLLKHL